MFICYSDLIQPFCRFQLNIQRIACCFDLFQFVSGLIFTINAKNLDQVIHNITQHEIESVNDFTWHTN